MAWIESHQELRDHPKVVRLARLLDVHRTSAVGMLHFLWWWALDHAEDGDLSDYEASDLAAACDWQGDPEVLVKALRDCGPGSREGFLAVEGDRLVLHDWWQYAGKLVERRRADRDRKRAGRNADPPEVPKTSTGRPPDIAETAYVTVPNPTQPNLPAPPEERREDVDRLCDLLADLVAERSTRRPTITKDWRDEARRLLDRDRVPLDEAERVMRWALDDAFWCSNVLSMPKFRKQYQALRLKAKAVNGTTPTAPVGNSGRRLL